MGGWVRGGGGAPGRANGSSWGRRRGQGRRGAENAGGGRSACRERSAWAAVAAQVSACLSSASAMGLQSSMHGDPPFWPQVQFHAVALLHALRASDRLAISKLVTSLTKAAVKSPLAQCLLVRYVAQVRSTQPPAWGAGNTAWESGRMNCTGVGSLCVTGTAGLQPGGLHLGTHTPCPAHAMPTRR